MAFFSRCCIGLGLRWKHGSGSCDGIISQGVWRAVDSLSHHTAAFFVASNISCRCVSQVIPNISHVSTCSHVCCPAIFSRGRNIALSRGHSPSERAPRQRTTSYCALHGMQVSRLCPENYSLRVISSRVTKDRHTERIWPSSYFCHSPIRGRSLCLQKKR